jgi:hypothetical protein
LHLISADFGFARFLQDGVMAATLCSKNFKIVSFLSLSGGLNLISSPITYISATNNAHEIN